MYIILLFNHGAETDCSTLLRYKFIIVDWISVIFWCENIVYILVELFSSIEDFYNDFSWIFLWWGRKIFNIWFLMMFVVVWFFDRFLCLRFFTWAPEKNTKFSHVYPDGFTLIFLVFHAETPSPACCTALESHQQHPLHQAFHGRWQVKSYTLGLHSRYLHIRIGFLQLFFLLNFLQA